MGFKKSIATMLVAGFAAASPALTVAPAVADTTRQSTITAEQARKYANKLHLAYIVSPSSRINESSEGGLKGLAAALKKGTTIHPAGVVGIDIEKDELSYFRFIYWPVTSDTRSLSEAARTKLQKYLDSGGFILIDIRGTTNAAEQAALLQRVLGGIRLRSLVPMPRNHTLTRSFFLVSRLRGSHDYGPVRVETHDATTESPEKGKLRHVSSVVVGTNNWADAWAGTTHLRTSEEYKMAMRAGINIVMYALLGNYKADQVHIPSIIERLEK